MGLIKEYFSNYEGIGIFGIISTILFVIAFLMMLYYTFSIGKEEVKELSRMPLEDEEGDDTRLKIED